MRPITKARGLMVTLAVGAIQCQAQSAQPTPSTPPAEDPRRLEAVKVTGRTAAATGDVRQTLSAEELRAYGSRSLADALSAIPSITILSNSRGEKEITIGGMGGGYTQLLVNGEVPPRGFSLESIPVDMIERVEIIKSGRADLSSQAVAGTINIVLRRVSAASERVLNASAGLQGDQPSTSLSYVTGRRDGDRSWSLASAYTREASELRSRAEAATGEGADTTARQTVWGRERPKQQMLSLSPRLTVNLDAGRSVTVDGTVQAGTFRYLGLEQREHDPPQALSVAANRTAVDSSLVSFLGSVAAASRSEDMDLTGKLTLGSAHRASDGHMLATGSNGDLLLARDVDASQSDQTATLTGKVVWKSAERHAVSAGVDAQAVRRAEGRDQFERSPVGLPTEDMHDDVSATILRQALFLQDEWTSDEEHAVYAGLRWEGVSTRAGQQDEAAVRLRHDVLSPVFQGTLKTGRGSDQVRLNLGRTYRMPSARDLIPRKWVMNDNSPTTPNFIGNPGLRPEVAWSVGLSYDAQWNKTTSFNIGTTFKDIQDVVMQSVTNEGGIWISRPENFGSARLWNISTEMKSDFNEKLILKFAFNQNYSTVTGGRAIFGQPRTSLALNIESRQSPVNWGGSIRYERWVNGNATLQQTSLMGPRATVDLFASRAFGKALQGRIAVTNLLSRGRRTDERFASGDIWERRYLKAAAPAKVTVGIECKL